MPKSWHFIAHTHHWQPSGGDAACAAERYREQVNLLVVEPGDNAALCLLAQPGLTLAGRVMQLGDVIKIMNDRLQPAQSAVSYSLAGGLKRRPGAARFRYAAAGENGAISGDRVFL
jgi:cell division protein ZapC